MMQGMFEYFNSLGVPRKSADVDPYGPIPWASEGMVTFGQSIREGFMDIASNDVEHVTGEKAAFAAICLRTIQGSLAAMIRNFFSPPAGGRGRGWAFALAASLSLSACGESFDPASIDTATYGAGENWDNPGGDWAGSHFSRLETIDARKRRRTGAGVGIRSGQRTGAGSHAGGDRRGDVHRGNLGRVYALDATTGRELWTFTPEMDMQITRSACCDWANRGVAVADGPNGKLVFVAALDGMLYALNADDGSIAWQTDTITDRARAYTITGAPEVAGDLVVIGNAGAEYDTRGYVTAYRVADGEQAWRFFTVPHDPAEGPQESEALDAASGNLERDIALGYRRRRHRLGCDHLRSAVRSGHHRHRQRRSDQRPRPLAGRGGQSLSQLAGGGGPCQRRNELVSSSKPPATAGT